MNRRCAALWCFILVGLAAGGCAAPGGEAVQPSLADPCDDLDAVAAWREARAAIVAGDDASALPLLKLAVSRCPELVRAHCSYQDAARRLGGVAEEEMTTFYAGLRGEGSAVPAYMRARLAETAYAQANDLKQILSKHRGFAWAHLSLARVNRGQGRLSESLAGFRRALQLDASLVEAARELAQVLAELGRTKEAAVAYESYLKARPGDRDAACEYVGLLLYRLGRIGAAKEWIDRLQAAGDRSIALRMDEAAASWRSGLHRAAAETYVGILSEQPDNALAALNVGLLYYEVVPTDEASRRVCWPRARAAFQMFQEGAATRDGHEQFEQTWAVPYRLRVIGDLIGAGSGRAPSVADLGWPEGL